MQRERKDKTKQNKTLRTKNGGMSKGHRSQLKDFPKAEAGIFQATKN